MQGGNLTLETVRRCSNMRSHTEKSTYFVATYFANRSKLKRHIKAIKQYLTRKEWRKGEQSCSLEELQKKTHRTKKGLREREKREKQKSI